MTVLIAKRARAIALIGLVALAVSACARGPNGERAALDNAVVRPGSTPYSFSGGYAGATSGGFTH